MLNNIIATIASYASTDDLLKTMRHENNFRSVMSNNVVGNSLKTPKINTLSKAFCKAILLG